MSFTSRLWRFLSNICVYLWTESKVWFAVLGTFIVFCAICAAIGSLWLAVGLPDCGVGRGALSFARPLRIGLMLAMALVHIAVILWCTISFIQWISAEWRKAAL